MLRVGEGGDVWGKRRSGGVRGCLIKDLKWLINGFFRMGGGWLCELNPNL